MIELKIDYIILNIYFNRYIKKKNFFQLSNKS